MGRGSYIVKRVFTSFLTLFIVSFFTFLFTQILPGDAAQMIAGKEASPERLEQIRRNLGLYEPLYVQYADWLIGVLTLNLGRSFIFNEPVIEVLAKRIPRSAYLATATVVLGVSLSIPLGVIASRHRDGWIDFLVSSFTFAGISIPNFFWGLIFILVFARTLELLPPSGYVDPGQNFGEFVRRLTLPTVALTWYLMAYITRMTRSSMLEVMGKNYIRTAVAKGVTTRNVVYKHGLRNALLPTLTVIAFQVGYVFGGVIVIETVFAYPGVGSLTYQAILDRDLPLIQGAVMVIATVFIFANLTVDILYTVVDPRIKYGGDR
ncbi:ABC transporter permease [Halorussus salinisoli]|uniref:ABC transporter permease n=1 Tax=Halorussus salinisoli TaxID=2558242 RepID=UPI0010C20688|nr:ABC transporter permease [Halorussus salinisoli]